MTKEIIKKIKIPLIFLIIFLTLYFFWYLLDLPDQASLIRMAEEYFDKYGLIVVFLSAVIEALLMVGFYYPGGMVILLGVIFIGPDPLKTALLVVIVTFGMVASYTVNFFLGKYGWYRLFLVLGMEEGIKKGQEKLTKHGVTAIALSNWHPNFGSITATAAGILHFPFRKYILFSFLSSFGWNIFWGTVAYFFGSVVLSVIGLRLALFIILIWIAIIVFSNRAHEQTT